MVTTFPRPAARTRSCATPGVARAACAEGYTLVELLLAMGVGLVLMSAAILVARQSTQVSNVLMDGASTQEEVQFSIEWITAALRAAGANPYRIITGTCPAAGTTFTPIRLDPNATGRPDNIRIHADINPPNGLLGGVNGACTESGEDITIAHDPTNLYITRLDNNIDAAAVPMTDRVISALQFTYLNAQGVATATASQVAYVQVSITGRTIARDVGRGAAATYTLTSDVRVRLR